MHRIAAQLGVVAASLCLFLTSGLAQSLTPADEAAKRPGDLQQRAERLERQSSWLAAADAYGELAREQPGVPEWQKRIRLCRQQDQITRRYANPQQFAALTFERALELYSEVIAKFDAHYVAEMDFSRVLALGLADLDLALQNPMFIERAFAGQVEKEALTRCRNTLRNRWWDVQVSERGELIRKVRALATSLQQDLGARPAVVVLELVHAACALDEFGGYLPPDQLALEETLAQAEVAGIGVDLRLEDGQLRIAYVAPSSSAARAGVRAGDQLQRIDDQPANAWSLEEALLRLMGPVGSMVVLDLHSPMEMRPRRLEVSRQRLCLPSVADTRIVDGELGIGYIHLAYFSATTIEEFDLAVAKLAMQGMRALILDLRGNPGGDFHQAVRLADRFISTGVLVTTRGRSMGSTVVYRTQEDMDVIVPLVVLIDGESASASEVVAGAIKDHRRGLIVGTRSFGKGSVQQVFPLRASLGGVRLTTAKFYSPLDSCYSEHGVTPDLLVERPPAGPSANSTIALQRLQFEAALRAAVEVLMKPM